MKNLVLASIINTVLLTGCVSSQKSTDAEAAGQPQQHQSR